MKRVLVIDDEEAVTTFVKRGLEKTGLYEVAAANEAANALATAKQFKPDLILLDILLPGTSGGKVAATLSADPELSRVPIIFLTGLVNKQETGPRGLFTGGRRVLAKPVTLAELAQSIEAALPGDGAG